MNPGRLAGLCQGDVAGGRSLPEPPADSAGFPSKTTLPKWGPGERTVVATAYEEHIIPLRTVQANAARGS